jgi:hypothetical protein
MRDLRQPAQSSHSPRYSLLSGRFVSFSKEYSTSVRSTQPAKTQQDYLASRGCENENGGTGPPFLLLSVCNFLNQNLALSPDAAAF